MSKTERRKFFQPIPLSSILDPRYQTPFSKLQQFQVDMNICSSKIPTPQPHHHQQPRNVWQKLQSSLLSAMSNLVVISQPVFTSAAPFAKGSSVPFVPFVSCKSFTASCDNLPEGEAAAISVQPQPASLYHSVRSGLQYLRYLATHPLYRDDHHPLLSSKRSEEACRKQYTIIAPRAFSLASGAPPFFSLFSDTTPRCQSAHTSPVSSPVRQLRQQPTHLPNLFCWAMSGILVADPAFRHTNFYYKNIFFSPVLMKGSGRETMSAPVSPHKFHKVEPLWEANFDIVIQSMASSTVNSQLSLTSVPASSSPTSPTDSSVVDPSSSASRTQIPAKGCIRFGTNWKSGSLEDCSLPNFHTVSVCSSTSALKGGTLTFSCSSTMSTSPRPMCAGGGRMGTRRKTESESSADSFIEFSASVESTDGFCIVFESAGGCLEDVVRDGEDDDWEDDDEEVEDDSDEEDEDQVFNYRCSDDLHGEGLVFQADVLEEGDKVDGSQQLGPPTKKKAKTVSSLNTSLIFHLTVSSFHVSIKLINSFCCGN